jgi:hypothetical protein
MHYLQFEKKKKEAVQIGRVSSGPCSLLRDNRSFVVACRRCCSTYVEGRRVEIMS